MVTDRSQLDSKLQVFNSNSMEVLARIVAAVVREHPLKAAFSPEQVVVANQGIANYLTVTLADENGICANLHYVRLWDLIWSTLRVVFPSAGTVNRFSHEHLTWSIFSLKEQWGSNSTDSADQCLQALRVYLADDEDGTRAFELSSRIADTFDQYQMYRHDWIEQWNELTPEDFALYAENPASEGRVKRYLKRTATHGEHFDRSLYSTLEQNLWQPRLWSMLRSNLDDSTFEPGEDLRFATLDRASCIFKLCEALSDPKLHLGGLPERLFIFGLSTMSPLELMFVEALSKRVEIYYLLLNPCCDYWGDLSADFRGVFARFKELVRLYSQRRVISEQQELKLGHEQEVCTEFVPRESDYDEESLERVEGHPLLLSLGREEMELLSRLLSDGEGVDFLDAFVPPECDSMLHEIQRSLLYAFKESEQKRPRPLLDPLDDSLVVHSCHTVRREVEVLRDALLSRFSREQGQLRLRDCVVMVPDIEEFTPYIHAVFGGLNPTDPRYLPYRISDRSEANESLVAQAVLQLLSISVERVTASMVTELLAVPAIAEKFAISAEDLTVISGWCNEARLYWGLDDAEVTAQLKSAGEITLPWTFERALLRMLEGYMLGRVEGRADLYTEIEGDDAELLGRFHAFVQKLIALRQLFTPSFNAGLEEGRQDWPLHEATSWMRIIEEQVIAEFFVEDAQTETELMQLREVVEAMQKAIYNLRRKPQITLPVFAALLKRRLGTAALRQPALGDYINFCSLVPMRAVPFRHVFILGLNEGVFPRQDQDPAFNLTSLPRLRRKGDRSRGADDRLLFLEALLSAEESLELFYIGVRPENQQSCVPSVVLSELLDFCTDYFALPVPDSSPELMLDRLVRQETMTAYNERNYLAHGPLIQSYDREHFLNTAQSGARLRPQLGDLLDYSSLIRIQDNFSFRFEQLAKVLSNPCQAFLEETLGLKLNLEYDSTVRDDEPFVLSSFEQGHLLNSLLSEAQHPDGELRVHRLLDGYAKGGALPYGEFGELTSEQLKATFMTMYDRLAAVCNFMEEPKSLHYEHSLEVAVNGRTYKISFAGEISDHYVYLSPYTDKLTNVRMILNLVTASLALYYADAGHSVVYAVLKDGRVLSADVRRHPSESPEEILSACAALYVRAHLGPLPYNSHVLQVEKSHEPETLLAKLSEQVQQDGEELGYVFGQADTLAERTEVLQLLAQTEQFYSEMIKPCTEEEVNL